MPARVLVVAAPPVFQSQLADMLGRDGHEIFTSDETAGLNRWHSERPDLVLIDDELPGRRGIELVSRIRHAESGASHTPMILIGTNSEVSAKVAALRAGADDYMAKPVHPQELSARVRGLMARYSRASSAARKETPGRVHAYYGAKGGVGSTTVAINTAIALRRVMKRKVVLVDANLQFGDHRVFLDLAPTQRSIVDAITAETLDADELNRVVVRHDSGIDVLLAPPTPEAAELVSSEQHHLLRVIELLRSRYDHVIVDMEKRFDDPMLDVIGTADRLVVVMTADLSCIKNVRLVLETMSQLHVPDGRLMLVLNRSNAFTGISSKSVESVLKHRIAHHILNDYRSAVAALNSGTPFMYSRPDSPLGKGIVELARLFEPDAPAGSGAGQVSYTPAYA